GNSANGVWTANLAPPSSAKSVLTPRPQQISLQTPTTSGATTGREKDSGGRQNYSALPPLPRGQPPVPPGSNSASGSRSGRSLHPTHGREQSQSHSPAPDYANNPLPPPPSSSSTAWPGDYGLPKGPTPGNLAGGAYANTSGRASPGPNSRSTSSRTERDRERERERERERDLNHKKSGSLGGAVGNLIAGLKGSTWSASSHPYANASAPNDTEDPSSSNAGYKVGRGPFGKYGHHHQTSSGNPLSLEDIRIRTIKVTMDEGKQTKLTRTINISDCETGMDVLQTALKKFGKNFGHGEDELSGETEQGGLVVGGWGVFVDGVVDEAHNKPLTEVELLNICHADASSPARDRLALRRVLKPGKLRGFFGEDIPARAFRISPTSPTFPARTESDTAASLAVPGTNSPTARPNASSKKMNRASTVSIMSGLGANPAWPGLANLGLTPPATPGGTAMATSVTMEARTPTSVGKEATKKLRNFFGQRPPSDIIYTHQQDFFPAVEKKVLDRTATARQSIFRGNTGHSKRMSTISALGSNGIGGGSDDGGRRSMSSNRHRSRFSVSSNGSALTPAQALAVANNPNIPPVPSPPFPMHLKPTSNRPRVSIEEPLPRMSVSTEDGKSVDLNSDEDDVPPPTPHVLPPVSVGGESLSESLSADFARSPLLGGSILPNNKRQSFLQELRSKRDTSDTASMLTLDEITEKVESRRQSMMGTGTSDGLSSDDDYASDTLSVQEEEEEEEEEEETIVEEDEEEYDEEEEEEEGEEEYDDDGMPKKTTSAGDKRVIKWVKGALIGSGSFGSVYLGMDAQQGLLMAVKQVSLPTGNSANEERKKSMLSALEREIDLLKQLQHEHIVQYLDSSIDNQFLNIFLEYVPGGSITTLLKNYGAFEESLVKIWVRQILTGLNYLHEKGIIHRDIKGANILVDNRGGIKISDFGISKKIEDVDVLANNARGHRASLQGSVFWMAPEVVKQTGHSAKADIWSVGCVIVEMLTGEHPYPKASQMQAIFKIGSYAKPDNPPDITPEAEDFLSKTFEIDHNLRPSVSFDMSINVLVYDGPGVSQTSVTHTLHSLRNLLRPNYSVNTITPQALVNDPWTASCALLVIPGGRDIPYVSALAKANPRIKEYVKLGGSFLGICAGGYYGSARVEWEIGTHLEVVGDRELAFFPGTAKGCAFEGFVYESEAGARAIDVLVNATESPKTFKGIYYNGGGYFENAENLQSKGVRILSTYPNGPAKGKAAAVACDVGAGRAILLGPHIEYPITLEPAASALKKSHPDLTDAETAELEKERWDLMKTILELLGLHSPYKASQDVQARTPGPLPQVLVSAPSDPSVIPRYLDVLRSICPYETPNRLQDANDTFNFHPSPNFGSLLQKMRKRHAEEGDLALLERDIVIFEGGSLPTKDETPLFDLQAYFDHLAAVRSSLSLSAQSNKDAWGMGEGLLYGEIITSTQTLFDK
ncbi:ATP binding, partial [Tulasnella sp. 427]